MTTDAKDPGMRKPLTTVFVVTLGDMPPQPEVTPEQAGHAIAYVRRRQRNVGIR